MMTKIKYVGLFAILPLLTIAVSSEYIQDADARPGTGGLDAKKVALGPYFDLVDVQSASANSENLYNAIFDVFAGDFNVTNLQMLVKSDMETIKTFAGSNMNAGDHSTTTIKIRAHDPSSIRGEILGWGDNPGSQIGP